jgi:hypothetical protein
MRDRTAWRTGLIRRFRAVTDAADLNVGRLLDVELGLFLLETVIPGEPIGTLPDLLAGYPVLNAAGVRLTQAAADRLAVARYLLLPLRTRRDWSTAIEAYAAVPPSLRGYSVEGDAVIRRAPSVAPERFELYEQTLATLPPLRRSRARVAASGVHEFIHRGATKTAVVPEDVAEGGSPLHSTAVRADRSPFVVTFAELAATAGWLDQAHADAGGSGRSWSKRLARVSLEVRTDRGFAPSTTLTVDGVLHLIGMVGSGKSTLMILTAVAAARRGKKTTLVVGDVISAVRLADELRAVGLRASPIIGASTHETHIQRLHQLRALDRAGPGLLQDADTTHDLLSTACALDALLPEPTILESRDAPCERLKPRIENADRASLGTRVCPFWARCQRHRTSVESVDADIWIATIPSLIYTRVPVPLSDATVRYLELAWRRSDLIIVDEADQVQAQLDAIFSPGQTLVGHGGDAWIDQVADHTDTELRSQARRQFGERAVREWSSHVDRARSVANRIYALLQREHLPRDTTTMRRWIGRDCFSEWTLANKLLRSWCPHDHPARDTLRAGFDAYLTDPLGGRDGDDDKVAASLRSLTGDLLNSADEAFRGALTSSWLAQASDELGLATKRGRCSPSTRTDGPRGRALGHPRCAAASLAGCRTRPQPRRRRSRGLSTAAGRLRPGNARPAYGLDTGLPVRRRT